jgi:hypothetical protein
MKRPKPARLIDVTEKREAFKSQVSWTTSHLQAVMGNMLALSDAPKVPSRRITAADLIALLRGLIDAASEREEGESDELLQRTEGAVWGYLRS